MKSVGVTLNVVTTGWVRVMNKSRIDKFMVTASSVFQSCDLYSFSILYSSLNFKTYELLAKPVCEAKCH